MASRSVRSFLTILMDLLVVVAVIVVVRIVIEFFGTLAAESWGKSILNATRYLVLPLQIASIKTPYAGFFNVSAAATVLIVLGIEWALGVARNAS